MEYSKELEDILFHLLDLNEKGKLESMALVVKEKDSSSPELTLANISRMAVTNFMDESLLTNSAMTITEL